MEWTAKEIRAYKKGMLLEFMEWLEKKYGIKISGQSAKAEGFLDKFLGKAKKKKK